MLIPQSLRRGFETLLAPLVARLVALGVHPNTLTTMGTLVLVGGAVCFALGFVRAGAMLLLLSGVFDMLDGRVARSAGTESRFGAFYDSTLDRVGESALFAGIAVYFATRGLEPTWTALGVGMSVAALAAGLLVSYTRARAEGLGVECKVGIATRAERVLGLGVPCLFVGAGPRGFVLLAVVSLLALLSIATVVQRVLHVRRATVVVRRQTQARWAEPVLASLSRKGRGSE